MKTTSVSEHGTTTENRQLIVEGVTDKAGIAGVRAAVWSNRSGGADLKWYLLEPYGDNWRAIIKVADYDFETGNYQVHIYGTDGYGNDGMMGAVAFYIAPIYI